MLLSRSIRLRDDLSAFVGTLQFMNSTTTKLPLRSWRFIWVSSALMLLSWRLNYVDDDCRCATVDYLLALNTFHNSIFHVLFKMPPRQKQKTNYILWSDQQTTFSQSTQRKRYPSSRSPDFYSLSRVRPAPSRTLNRNSH